MLADNWIFLAVEPAHISYKVNRQIGDRDLKYVGENLSLSIGHVIRRMRSGFKRIANGWSMPSMGNVRTHKSRIDTHKIFKRGEGIDHVTSHAWPLRPKSKG